jgi:hypothetical protein
MAIRLTPMFRKSATAALLSAFSSSEMTMYPA